MALFTDEEDIRDVPLLTAFYQVDVPDRLLELFVDGKSPRLSPEQYLDTELTMFLKREAVKIVASRNKTAKPEWCETRFEDLFTDLTRKVMVKHHDVAALFRSLLVGRFVELHRLLRQLMDARADIGHLTVGWVLEFRRSYEISRDQLLVSAYHNAAGGLGIDDFELQQILTRVDVDWRSKKPSYQLSHGLTEYTQLPVFSIGLAVQGPAPTSPDARIISGMLDLFSFTAPSGFAEIIRCAGCNSPFIVQLPDQEFCSARCRKTG